MGQYLRRSGPSVVCAAMRERRDVTALLLYPDIMCNTVVLLPGINHNYLSGGRATSTDNNIKKQFLYINSSSSSGGMQRRNYQEQEIFKGRFIRFRLVEFRVRRRMYEKKIVE